MKRLKSIDIFRGVAMVYLMIGHMIDWWIISSEDGLFYAYISLFSAFGAAGFVFLSGISTMISYRNRIERVKTIENYTSKTVRKEYFIRALLVLGLAFGYNSIVAIMFLDPLIIWKWFIIMTVAGSLFLAWPLLKTSKWVRIIFGVLIWGVNQIVVSFLLPYEGNADIFGWFFYVLYNSPDQNPILSFLTFFLIGTVIGDILYDFSSNENEIERKRVFKRKIIAPLLISGVILIITSLWFLFPYLFTDKILTIKTNISWLIYTLGLDLIILLVLLILEEYNIFNTKKSYRSIYYFSYYSLSLFILQNVNFFLFFGLLNRYSIWFFTIATVAVYGVFLRFIYIKLEGKFSLKVQIGIITNSIVRKKRAVDTSEKK